MLRGKVARAQTLDAQDQNEVSWGRLGPPISRPRIWTSAEARLFFERYRAKRARYRGKIGWEALIEAKDWVKELELQLRRDFEGHVSRSQISGDAI